MQRFLIVLVLLAVVVVGLGFYQGWFHVGSEEADGKSNVTLSVDKDKIKEDKKAAVEKVQNMEHQVKDKVAGSGEQTMDGTAVRVSEDQLTMTSSEGKEHSHTLAANVKVTCDGKVCKAVDIKPGMRIRVTTGKAEPQVATRIEALDNQKTFEKGA